MMNHPIALHFNAGVPDIPVGDVQQFIVVTKTPEGKHSAFAAYYLNAHPLEYEESCDERGYPKDQDHSDGCPTTGWFYDESNFEYDHCYHELRGDVLAWSVIPNGEDVAATLEIRSKVEACIRPEGHDGPCNGWPRPECLRPAARPLSEYHEGMGEVTWWSFPVIESPYIGSPLDEAWPGYHTHFTPAPVIPVQT